MFWYLEVLKYRLTDIIKPKKFYHLYITVYMHIVFLRRKKSFLIIEMKQRHCITLQKNTEKTILLYITVTVSRGTYLGIDQSMKHKFVSNGRAACLTLILWFFYALFLHFLAWSNFIIIAETTTFPKIRFWNIISRCKWYNTRKTRNEMTFAQNQFNFSLNIKL